jgi:hypothetical protein
VKIVRLMGGIGNQMFQYAFGEALSFFTGEEVLFDKLNFEARKKEEIGNSGVDKRGICIKDYELGIFNLNIQFADKKQIKSIKNKPLLKIPQFIRKNLHIKDKVLSDNIAEEKQNTCYEHELLKISGDAYYQGYFQSEKYFKDISGFLISSFRFPPFKDDENKKFADKILNAQDAVFIQVRRGDYLAIADTDKIMCSVEYYKKGAEYIAQRVENPQFFVFSAEDPDWAIKNLNIGFPFEIIGAENTGKEKYYENMHLMSLCRHAVLANSSYSWWGAWLNQNSNKIIVAPDPWFSTNSDIYCDSWVKISRE